MAELVVWFDGNCPLCRREIAMMRRLDQAGAITFVDLASGPENCPLDKAELLARFHALDNGRLVSGAEAFAAMWRAIPRLRFLGLLAQNRLILALLEQAYLLFLRFRPALQRFVVRLESKTP